MNELITTPQFFNIYTALTLAQRNEFNMWLTIINRVAQASEKNTEIASIIRDYAGTKGITRSSIYRKIDAYNKHKEMGIISKTAMRRIAGERGGLPKEFVDFWLSLCGDMQRQKVMSAHRTLWNFLMSGKTIPGYNTNWEGMWRAQFPDTPPPERGCPREYTNALKFPKGWSYANLFLLKPKKAEWEAATKGIRAMSAFLPSVPHTRAGMEFAKYFVIDDMKHDNKVSYLNNSRVDTPLELAMLEYLTGKIVTWGLTPIRYTDDGSRIMLKESYVLYLVAHLLCGIGVNPNGIVIIAEHGTAAIRKEALERINRALEPFTGNKEFVKVITSGVTGKAVAKGLYDERAGGNPRFKAALESAWNLLHNELAMLPGQTGRNPENSPADMIGREREDKQLEDLAIKLCKAEPDAVRNLFRYNHCNYFEFEKILAITTENINNRTKHKLEGWEECGFTKLVATYLNRDYDLDELYLDSDNEQAQKFADLIKATNAPIRNVALSPTEAWKKCELRYEIIRFPIEVAALILAPIAGEKIKVSESQDISLTNELNGIRKHVWNAIIRDTYGKVIKLNEGEEYIVMMNPFDATTLLVCDTQHRYLGSNKSGYVPAPYGDDKAIAHNLGQWQEAKAATLEKTQKLLSNRKQARAKQLAHNTAALKALPVGASSAPDSSQSAPSSSSISIDDLLN